MNKRTWKQAFLWMVANSFNFPELHAINNGLQYTAWHFLPAQRPPQLSCTGTQHSVTLPPLAQWPDKFATLTQAAREKRAIIQPAVPVLLTELLFITRARYSIREGERVHTIVGEVLGKLCLGADGSLLKRSDPGDQLSLMPKFFATYEPHTDHSYCCVNKVHLNPIFKIEDLYIESQTVETGCLKHCTSTHFLPIQ